MARSDQDKKKLLETLAEAPFVSLACKKIGIARATYYRWRENLGFAEEVERALQIGRDRGNDIAEAALFKEMQNGSMPAIRFFLQNNDPRYAPKRPIQVNQHISLEPGDTCPFCKGTQETPLDDADKEALERLLRKNNPSYEPIEVKPKSPKSPRKQVKSKSSKKK